MGAKVDTEDLVTASEVAQLLGLSQHNSVSTYLSRYSDFPQPVVEKSGGRIRLWLRQEIGAWADSRASGQEANRSAAPQRPQLPEDHCHTAKPRWYV